MNCDKHCVWKKNTFSIEPNFNVGAMKSFVIIYILSIVNLIQTGIKPPTKNVHINTKITCSSTIPIIRSHREVLEVPRSAVVARLEDVLQDDGGEHAAAAALKTISRAAAAAASSSSNHRGTLLLHAAVPPGVAVGAAEAAKAAAAAAAAAAFSGYIFEPAERG